MPSHPQTLAKRSKQTAVAYLLGCLFFAVSPLVVWLLFPQTSVILLIFLLIVSRVLYLFHKKSLIRLKQASAGVEGEQQIATLLKALPSGWIVEESVPLPRLGDADFLVRSPFGKAFVIEVKSHSGLIDSNGTELLRKKAGKTEPFQKDFIKQVLMQASALQSRAGTKVTPLLVFSKAKVVSTQKEIAGVHLLQSDELLAFLQSQ